MIPFLLKSALVLAILFALYKFLLEREKMPRFNRFYLLVGLAVAFVLPLITIPIYVQVKVPEPQKVFIATQIPARPISEAVTPQIKQEPTPQKVAPKPAPVIEWADYLTYVLWSIYGLVTVLLAIRFTVNIVHFYRKAKRNKRVALQGATVVLLNDCPLPYTFMNFVFVNKADYEGKVIEAELLTHELAHVRQRHTLDVLFVELLKTVFWFNPLLYLYKKAIQTNHEFLADEAVLSQHDNIPIYQLLLLDKATPPLAYALASGINFSTTKKRFTMMTKTTSKRRSIVLKISVIPVLIGVIMTFATREEITTIQKPVERKGNRVSDDSLDYKQRRDAYYKGVKVDIDDRIAGVHLVMPYEQLTEKQKQKYIFSVPQKMKKQRLTVQEFKKLTSVLKYFVTIDGFQIDNAILCKYKPSDFESYSVIYKAKNAVTEEFPQAVEYHLYTPEYYNRLFKDAHLINHFPDSVYKVKWFKELKNSRAVTKKRAVFYDVKTVMFYLDDSQPVDYTKLNKLPQYPGGTAKFNAFIQKNLILPNIAPEHISTYHLALVIEADGVVSRIKVLNAEDAETPKAFAKAMVNSAAWKPGILNGKAVRSQYAVKVDL